MTPYQEDELIKAGATPADLERIDAVMRSYERHLDKTLAFEIEKYELLKKWFESRQNTHDPKATEM